MTGSTKCWHCGGRLEKRRGGEELIFELVDGRRVHKVCRKAATQKPITAQPRFTGGIRDDH